MAIRIVPYSARETSGALAFNERMRKAQAPTEFLLPEEPPAEASKDRAIRAVYYLAVEGEAVRGGFVLRDCPAWLDGAGITAANCLAPLSEGIIDRKHSSLAMHFLRYMLRHSPYVFSVGMGNADNPYPRFLRAAGWTVLNVPFFYRVCRPARFFRELAFFRQNRLRAGAARVAAATGLGALAVGLLQLQPPATRAKTAELTIETPASWAEWADEIWGRFKTACSFSGARDARTLEALYPIHESTLRRFLLRREGHPVAWGVAQNTQMRQDRYFGNLRVATILDCLGHPDELAGAVAKVTEALAAEGAELVITNQCHAAMQAAFRRAGFRQGPSVYQLGLSKPLMERIRAGLGERAIHLTRGDGDGRMHL